MSGVDVAAKVRAFIDATWAPWKLQGVDTDLTADDLHVLLDEVERLRRAVRYCAQPSMALPSGRDAEEFARDEAAEELVRAALTACIRTARAALEQP